MKKLLSKPLANLINLSFSTGLFPKIHKQAKIIPIFKKGDQQDCNRPISLLLNSSKIIEKLINRQLYYGFLQFNNYLYTNQFGFCSLHSIHHALRDCQQITFVTLNRLCPLRDTNQNQLKNTHLFHIVFEVLKVLFIKICKMQPLDYLSLVALCEILHQQISFFTNF